MSYYLKMKKKIRYRYCKMIYAKTKGENVQKHATDVLDRLFSICQRCLIMEKICLTKKVQKMNKKPI